VAGLRRFSKGRASVFSTPRPKTVREVRNRSSRGGPSASSCFHRAVRPSKHRKHPRGWRSGEAGVPRKRPALSRSKFGRSASRRGKGDEDARRGPFHLRTWRGRLTSCTSPSGKCPTGPCVDGERQASWLSTGSRPWLEQQERSIPRKWQLTTAAGSLCEARGCGYRMRPEQAVVVVRAGGVLVKTRSEGS